MAQPDTYTPAHEFLTDEAATPALPGSELDIEFNALAAILEQYQTNLALIQRDDGALKNGIVTAEALDTVLAAALGDLDSLAEVQALVDAADASADAAATNATAAASSATSASSSASSAS